MATKLKNRETLILKIFELKFAKAEQQDLERAYVEQLSDHLHECDDDDLIYYAQNYGIDYEETPE